MTRLFELLDNLLLTKYAQFKIDQENQLIFIKQTSENKLFNLIKRINDKESLWIAQELNKSTNKSHLLYWRLNITLYIFLLQSLSIIIHSTFFQTNLIMFSHSFTEEHSERFQTHFSQISDVDSLKSRTNSSSAASFIHENDESFAEMIILLMFYEIWKT